ncbi:alpha-amylase family glycosyl hydrolase [Microbulbifer spongiae]|uniref:Alpha-amylase family glycosyl hydrolase n=1 Tax=Microbulbifer spongiae TaxID=2944933 RepID=A0ABY9EE81_9GAMM|nr:alpha-amylase family glycosyl hydrolase [Microbulbifer sp. MI-G]WKD50296.1 alpha-amylase family glycosyl hydrolase [Microbulbifer sp. MI-G]
MKKTYFPLIAKLLVTALLGAASCAHKNPAEQIAPPREVAQDKAVIYQVLPRLFGNTNGTNKPWGTIAENGVGKFSDFTPKALGEIRTLGATHIWYTGVLHHALVGDYTAFGIGNDDPDVVKGRAGSPYAIKDYYSVNPDLADNPATRLQEFRALVERSHAAGLKVIIDIVPNHVARAYQSLHKPQGVRDFGADDNTQVTYARNNNFYYVVGKDFRVPVADTDYRPLNGEANPLVDGLFPESPAKWTGNGARSAQPAFDDWYETVKINFGVRPDGSKHFPELPPDYARRDYRAHARFWAGLEVPDSWKKFRDVVHYWLDFGVDGFRYDMAGMVPVEFWSYLNASIKSRKPDALLLAEIYTPSRYRDYLYLGKMDFLYDKVGTYDAIRAVLQGTGSTDKIAEIQAGLQDISAHLLRFMENHDEQRIASGEFAGSAEAGKPAMLVSTALSPAPTLVYFGQELGEPANRDAGFGKASRTTIFDYWSVPSVRRWNNNGNFDTARLTDTEKTLRTFYQRLLNFSTASNALRGQYMDLHNYNRAHSPGYGDKQFAFARWHGEEKLLVVANFGDTAARFGLQLPEALLDQWHLKQGQYRLLDQISGRSADLFVRQKAELIDLKLAPYESHIFQLIDGHPEAVNPAP